MCLLSPNRVMNTKVCNVNQYPMSKYFHHIRPSNIIYRDVSQVLLIAISILSIKNKFRFCIKLTDISAGYIVGPGQPEMITGQLPFILAKPSRATKFN